MGYATGKHIILFVLMGWVYVTMELLWRGETHWAMFFVGGICGVCIGLINELIPWDMPLLLQGAIGTIIILIIEFTAGCILNLWLGWGVWDYSHMSFNLCGQICLPYAALWYLVALFCIILDDLLRWALWDEEKPRYRLI